MERIGRIPTSFRAKTARLVPELNRFYVAVPRHGAKAAAIRVYRNNADSARKNSAGVAMRSDVR